MSLDTQLRAKHQVAPRRIEFASAQHPEAASFQWHPKYAPINGARSAAPDVAPNKSKEPKSNTNTPEDTYTVPPPPAGLHWAEQREMGCGLDNLGNTCFLNSALQCLTYTPPLANLVLQRWHTKSCRKPATCLACELERHIHAALTRRRGSFAPRNIVSNLRRIGKHFRNGRQEDSHEFLRYLIEGVQRAMSHDDKLTRVDQGALFSVFGGYLQSQVKCTVCGYESNTLDPVLDMSLELKSKHIHSVHAALAHFCAEEVLDGDNKYKCPRCNKKVRAVKQFTIRQPPHVLTLQLKRFGFMGPFGGNNKITKTISYAEQLTLDPFLSHAPRTPQRYTLYGVLVHTGASTHSGHYFSYVRAPNRLWYRCDDSTVSQVSHSTALQQNAYMLFYVKSDEARAVTPVKEARVKLAPELSPRPDVRPVTAVKEIRVNGQEHKRPQETRVKEPVRPFDFTDDALKTRVNGDSVKGKDSVTRVTFAPTSVRGSGEWRVRNLSALSTLLANDHVVQSSEPIESAVTPVKEAPVKSTPAPAKQLGGDKPANGTQTRVKSEYRPPRDTRSVVDQLHALSQPTVSTWDVPEAQAQARDRDALLTRVTGVKRARDEYDVDYDRGKVKRHKRAHLDPFAAGTVNPFNAAQLRKGFGGQQRGDKHGTKHGKKQGKKHQKRRPKRA